MMAATLIALWALGGSPLQDGRDALSRSHFAEALVASEGLTHGLDAHRLRMDTLYAAGDLLGALREAQSIMAKDSRDPHGAYMSSRLALDLGLESRGRVALLSFQERLERGRAGMAQATVDWYEGKGAELTAQLDSLVGQGQAEQAALARARWVVCAAGVLVLVGAVLFARRPLVP
ncbi:MAG: hypothetical protein P1V35_08020 [Planctomycetota bacterium]|nr:hypothetical protein [Planctomycetota bacterium]